jgi:hypothetical protein
MNGSGYGPTLGIARRVVTHPAGALSRGPLIETRLNKQLRDNTPANRTNQVGNWTLCVSASDRGANQPRRSAKAHPADLQVECHCAGTPAPAGNGPRQNESIPSRQLAASKADVRRLLARLAPLKPERNDGSISQPDSQIDRRVGQQEEGRHARSVVPCFQPALRARPKVSAVSNFIFSIRSVTNV